LENVGRQRESPVFAGLNFGKSPRKSGAEKSSAEMTRFGLVISHLE
jgi:hypothetical protein